MIYRLRRFSLDVVGFVLICVCRRVLRWRADVAICLRVSAVLSANRLSFILCDVIARYRPYCPRAPPPCF